MTLLALSGVRAGYGGMEVLHGIDLTVDEGEIVGIVGPNGAGKSTLLKTIFRLLPLTEGDMRFGDHDLRGAPTHRLAAMGMGYVPQEGGTFADLSVEENLRVSLMNTPSRDVVRLLDNVFERFPALRDRRNQHASTLSGGERQMLAIAAATITVPRLLALDEPTTGLAPSIVRERIADIRRSRDEGTTIIWVIEEEPLACVRHCDCIFVMQSGTLDGPLAPTLVEDGTVLETLFFGAGDPRSTGTSMAVGYDSPM